MSDNICEGCGHEFKAIVTPEQHRKIQELNTKWVSMAIEHDKDLQNAEQCHTYLGPFIDGFMKEIEEKLPELTYKQLFNLLLSNFMGKIVLENRQHRAIHIEHQENLERFTSFLDYLFGESK